MENVEMASATLGHHKPGGAKTAAKPKIKPLKEFHAKELHDGSFHIEKHHGYDQHMMPVKPSETGSAPDLDGVHDALHEHMAAGNEAKEVGEKGGVSKKNEGPGDGEKGGEKKQGRESKPSEKAEKPTSEQDEKPGDEEMEEK